MAKAADSSPAAEAKLAPMQASACLSDPYCLYQSLWGEARLRRSVGGRDRNLLGQLVLAWSARMLPCIALARDDRSWLMEQAALLAPRGAVAEGNADVDMEEEIAVDFEADDDPPAATPAPAPSQARRAHKFI